MGDQAPKQRLIALLGAESGVRWAYLFGSAARDEPHRDLDVAVMLERDRGLLDLGGLASRLETALGGAIDLVDLRSAGPALVAEVLRDGILLVDSQRDARVEWEAESTVRWLDVRPTYEMFRALRREALRSSEQS
ncbi:MAG: nucleotidyltransferase domain-containing protein [Deltaproteobacteria bacterium]|nr:nucleotidyltransferase domain-containing protein [Deltaproteobacteria bacterium]MBW2256052.1 nucleotidyltransferase domain-containing protein [Deltaproteobacteria bacterium]